MNKKLSEDFKNSNETFIVAEIGINHNGDMGLAKESIIAAAESGANAVKFQNYKTEDFISNKNLKLTYRSQEKFIEESQYEIFKRCELNLEQLLILKEVADKAKVNFHSTPTSLDGIQDLKKIGCTILKNGSDYLTNLKLIREMGETGLLTVLSTGMSTLSEIDDAVRAFRETGNDKIILLHCTSSYPTNPEDVNLARINTLKKVFNVKVGFSDHTKGVTAAIGAVLLGSIWIEKHFTLDRSLTGPDHWFSMNPVELKNLVKSIRDAEKLVGNSQIIPTKNELKSREQFRLSCVASRDIESGSFLSTEDIVFQRPGDGIPPIYENFLLGKKIFHSIKKGQKYQKKHFNE